MTTLPAPVEAAPETRRLRQFTRLPRSCLVAVDNLWLLADWAALPGSSRSRSASWRSASRSYLIQKHFRGDTTGRALAIGSLLGVLAAVPTSITGPTAGLVVLGYAGFRWLLSAEGG